MVGLVDFSRVNESSPEDPQSSPEADAGPGNKCLLPVSFLLLQRMLIRKPDLGMSFQNGWAAGEVRESPLAVSSESDAVFGQVHGKRQDDVSQQSSSSLASDASSHMRTSLHTFPDHFQARRACHLPQEWGAPVFSLGLRAAPPSACLLRTSCAA